MGRDATGCAGLWRPQPAHGGPGGSTASSRSRYALARPPRPTSAHFFATGLTGPRPASTLLAIREGSGPIALAGLSAGSGQAQDDVGCVNLLEQSCDRDELLLKSPPVLAGSLAF